MSYWLLGKSPDWDLGKETLGLPQRRRWSGESGRRKGGALRDKRQREEKEGESWRRSNEKRKRWRKTHTERRKERHRETEGEEETERDRGNGKETGNMGDPERERERETERWTLHEGLSLSLFYLRLNSDHTDTYGGTQMELPPQIKGKQYPWFTRAVTCWPRAGFTQHMEQSIQQQTVRPNLVWMLGVIPVRPSVVGWWTL